MPQGLVTGLGVVPGLLPTPATCSVPRGQAQEPRCCSGEQREGQLWGQSYCQCMNGDIPWHGDSPWQGRGMGQQTWWGG